MSTFDYSPATFDIVIQPNTDLEVDVDVQLDGADDNTLRVTATNTEGDRIRIGFPLSFLHQLQRQLPAVVVRNGGSAKHIVERGSPNCEHSRRFTTQPDTTLEILNDTHRNSLDDKWCSRCLKDASEEVKEWIGRKPAIKTSYDQMFPE